VEIGSSTIRCTIAAFRGQAQAELIGARNGGIVAVIAISGTSSSELNHPSVACLDPFGAPLPNKGMTEIPVAISAERATPVMLRDAQRFSSRL
jgi:hypothetical protein